MTGFSPIGSLTKLRCFWLVLDMMLYLGQKAVVFTYYLDYKDFLTCECSAFKQDSDRGRVNYDHAFFKLLLRPRELRSLRKSLISFLSKFSKLPLFSTWFSRVDLSTRVTPSGESNSHAMGSHKSLVNVIIVVQYLCKTSEAE